MPRNVPDDWDCYWTTCSVCGRRYHQSEGGCDCLDGLECACGSNSWEFDPFDRTPTCSKCGSGPAKEVFSTSTVHVARIAHGGSIRAGDRYRRTVTGGYYPNGPRWMTVWKTRVEKGPAWEAEEAT